MNNQLIPVINGTIDGESALLCSARELYKFLGVGRDFSNWIKGRISDYGFVENQDYIVGSPELANQNLISQIRETKTGRGGDRRSKDYHLTLDTAKELAMVERNEKGRQVRRYFIDCEKRLHNQVAITSHKKPEVPKPEPQQRNYFACLQIRDEVTGGVIELNLRADCMHSLATGLTTCLGYRPIGFRSVSPRKDLMKKIV